jgi:hypothetical protein
MIIKDLVLWPSQGQGNLYNIRISRELRNYILPTPEVFSMLVGLILSEGWFVKRKGRRYVFIGLKQSIKNISFIINVWWK